MTPRPCRSLPRTALLAVGLLSVAGCAQFGAGIGLIAQAIPRTVDAAYKGLAGQQTVVMVWADSAVRLDNPLLQEDVAAAVQDKLITIQAAEHPDGLKGTTFPVATSVVIQAQQDHPEWENLSAPAVAVQLKGSRVIYLEVTDFTTRSEASLDLYRGTLTAHLSVVETTDGPDGKPAAKVGYDGGVISVVYPKDAPKEGLPNRTDNWATTGTINLFVDELAQRFYKHNEDRN